MASVSNEIGDYLSKQMVECSPYFDCMKLEGMPAISPVKFSELVVKEEQGIKKEEIEDEPNFLDYWNKEMINNHGINIKDIKEEIDAHGPVDAILRNFESQSMDSESFMNYDSVDQIQYNHNNQISDIINCNIDNFKQGIYDFQEDEICDQYSQEEIEDEEYQEKEKVCLLKKVKSELLTDNKLNRRTRKREDKFYRKLHSGNITFNKCSNIKQDLSESYNKKDNIQKEKKSLIIKITCGVNSKSKAIRSRNNKCELIGSIPKEESKSLQPGNQRFKDCSSSTSTLSNEKEDRLAKKLSKITEASIELENNIKIVCREVGPLKAEERKMKVLHYFEKKRSRKWQKRINYTTRKQVADVRPRYKGRFVTVEQSQMFEEIEKNKKEMKEREKIFLIERNCKPLRIANC